MNHPFALELSDLEAVDLDFEEYLTDQEAAQVGGADKQVTTLSYGEEGGKRWSPPIKPQPDPPRYTTQALGEEGGGLDSA